ncbi:hypothetical protein Hanom_Chr10g00932411 [Helianthus anomalus]
MSDEAYTGDDEAKVDGTPEVTGVLNGINGDCEIQGNSNHVADSSPIIADNNMEGLISSVMTKDDSVGQGTFIINNKRKKNKGFNSLGQEGGAYSSSNDRPKKDCRLEDDDPFGLAPFILGLNVTTNRGLMIWLWE